MGATGTCITALKATPSALSTLSDDADSSSWTAACGVLETIAEDPSTFVVADCVSYLQSNNATDLKATLPRAISAVASGSYAGACMELVRPPPGATGTCITALKATPSALSTLSD